MTFRIRITPEAEQDASDILDWLNENNAGEPGMRWFGRMSEAIDSLRDFPKRCALALDNATFSFEVRQLLYGNKPHMYRILFTVESDVVYILRIRHGRRLPIAQA